MANSYPLLHYYIPDARTHPEQRCCAIMMVEMCFSCSTGAVVLGLESAVLGILHDGHLGQCSSNTYCGIHSSLIPAEKPHCKYILMLCDVLTEKQFNCPKWLSSSSLARQTLPSMLKILCNLNCATAVMRRLVIFVATLLPSFTIL